MLQFSQSSNISTSQHLQQFKQAHKILESFFGDSLNTLSVQKQIYAQFINIFSYFHKKLTLLSNKINQQILKANNDQATVNTYQFLSNCLLRMSECSRKVATKAKHQVYDSLQVFGKNYEHICNDMLTKLNTYITKVNKSQSILSKSRQQYINSAQKLQKYKQMQNKVLTKVQKGDINQLQKFNSQMRKVISIINQNQIKYRSYVQKINQQWQQMKLHLNSINASMQYNQKSKVSFTRKSVQSSIKLLQQFNNAFDNTCTQKLQQTNNKMLQSDDKIMAVDKRLLNKIDLLVNTQILQQFVSFQEICRRKKKTLLEQESSHLNQIFSQVSQNDKIIIKKIVKPWFIQNQTQQHQEKSQVKVRRKNSDVANYGSPVKSQEQKQNQNKIVEKSKSINNLKNFKIQLESAKKINQNGSQSKNKDIEVPNQDQYQSKQQQINQQKKNENEQQKVQQIKNSKLSINQQNLRHQKQRGQVLLTMNPALKKATSAQMQIDNCKQKILSLQPYSFYFVEIVYQSIAEMPSFYCKVDQDNFFLLLNFFSTISKNLNIGSEIGIQLLYKMIQISQRITKKKSISTLNNQKGQPIELLCNLYGKSLSCLYENKNIKKLLNYIQKRKGLKKKLSQPEKSVVMGLAKGLFSVMTRKKEPTLPNLTEDQKFNCLQQLTNILANLALPNEISLPFLKKQLQNSQSTYDYLKGIILAKRDQQQRHKLLYKLTLKQKRQDKMKKLIQSKGISAYCLALTAKKGFLDQKDLHLRLVSKSLRNIHQQILHHLKIPINKKWPLLIAHDKNKDYRQMKNQVAQNSVPSAVQQIITLDVNRSLHLHGNYFSPTLLHSLLRVYAYYHKQISYCQGMNYIAGYIYIKTLNEESAYKIFQTVMQTRFKQLFLHQFKRLKQKMYQFERVLSIFHPQIAEHFKRQGISPQCYIVSWMITMFASTYQYTMQSYVVDILWQRFIIYGWKQFFKFVLWLFSYHKDDLLQMTYDKVLNRLGEAMRSQMFIASQESFIKNFGQQIGNLQEAINKFQVTDEMLDGFIKQYNLN